MVEEQVEQKLPGDVSESGAKARLVRKEVGSLDLNSEVELHLAKRPCCDHFGSPGSGIPSGIGR